MTILYTGNTDMSAICHKEGRDVSEKLSQTSSTDAQNVLPLPICSCDLCELFGNGHCKNFDFCYLNKILPNYSRVSYEIVNAESLTKVKTTIVELDRECQVCGDTVSGKGILNTSDSRIQELFRSEDKVSIYQKKQSCIACYLEHCSSVSNDTRDKTNIFVCQICVERFECGKEFQRHIGTHERILFPTCPFCGLIIENSDNILPHIHSHSASRRQNELPDEMSDLTQAAKHRDLQLQQRDLNDENERMSEYSSLSDEDGFESCSSDDEHQNEFEEPASHGFTIGKKRRTVGACSEHRSMDADSEPCLMETNSERATMEIDSERTAMETDSEHTAMETDSNDAIERSQIATEKAKQELLTNGSKSAPVVGNHNATVNIASADSREMAQDNNNNITCTNASLYVSIEAIQNQQHAPMPDAFLHKCKQDSSRYNSSTYSRKRPNDMQSTVNKNDFNKIESEKQSPSPHMEHRQKIVAILSSEIDDDRSLKSTEKRTFCSTSNKTPSSNENKFRPNKKTIHNIWKNIDRSKRLVIKEKLTFSKVVLLKAEFEKRQKNLNDKRKTHKSLLEDNNLASREITSFKSKLRNDFVMNNSDIGNVNYTSKGGKRHHFPFVEKRVRNTNSTPQNPKRVDTEKRNTVIKVSKQTHKQNIKLKADGKKFKRSNASFQNNRTQYHMKDRIPGSDNNITKLQCRYCEKVFKNNWTREIHEKIHTKENLLYCDICNKTCTNKGDMVKHMRVHSGDRPYVCDICNKAFSQNNNLERHYLIHIGHTSKHSAARSFKCDQCEKSYTQKAHLQRHQMLHTGERPVKCSRCDAAFVTRRDLKRHERKHELNKIYTCDVCNKKFNGSIKHAKHMRTHDGFKNFGRFECETCEKKFILKASFKDHMALHMREKPFSCSVCNKTFLKKREIVSHMTVHEKKHKCQECKAIFRNAKELRKHECRVKPSVNHG